MLYCEDCGQCSHISDEYFYEYRSTSGWERNLVNCENGEFENYANSESTDSEHDNYECRHCGGENIDTEWEGNAEEAEEQREEFEERRRQFSAQQEVRRQQLQTERQAKDPKREWDVVNNV